MAASDLTMYLIVRKDLKMSFGKALAQCGHAIEHLVRTTPKPLMQNYHRDGSAKIVLAVRGQDELLAISVDCAGISCKYLVVDAGKTELPENTITVLGIGPISKKDVPRSVANLSLY